MSGGIFRVKESYLPKVSSQKQLEMSCWRVDQLRMAITPSDSRDLERGGRCPRVLRASDLVLGKHWAWQVLLLVKWRAPGDFGPDPKSTGCAASSKEMLRLHFKARVCSHASHRRENTRHWHWARKGLHQWHFGNALTLLEIGGRGMRSVEMFTGPFSCGDMGDWWELGSTSVYSTVKEREMVREIHDICGETSFKELALRACLY